MCRKSLSVLAVIALVSFVAPRAADAQNTLNGFILIDEANQLFMMNQPFGAGPGANMKLNFIAPSEIGDPDFNPDGANPAGEFHGGPGPLAEIDFEAAGSTGFSNGGLTPFPIWVTLGLIEATFPVVLRRDQENTLFNWDGWADDINGQLPLTTADPPGPRTENMPKDNVMAIVTYYIELIGVAGVANFCTGSDDSPQVWVNNKCVLSKSTPRGSGATFTCQERTPAFFPSGVSKISYLVWEGGGGFNGRIGLELTDGTKLEDGMDLTGDGEPNFVVHGGGGGDFEGQEQYCLNREVPPAPKDCYTDPTKVTLQGMGPGDADDTMLLCEFVYPPAAVITDVSNDGIVEDIIVPDDGLHEVSGAALEFFVLGPIANGGGAAPGEALIRAEYLSIGDDAVNTLAEGDVIADVNGTDQTVRRIGVNQGDLLNFDLVGGGGDNIMHYAWTQLTLAADTDVIVGVASDDSVQVLVNNVEVILHNGGRGAGGFGSIQNRSDRVSLAAGTSTFLTKVYEGGGGHAVRLIILEAPALLPNVGAGGESCADATAIAVGEEGSGSTAGADANPGPASCLAFDGSPDHWFVYTGTGSPVTASTCASGYDTALEYHTACDTDCVFGQDDSCGVQVEIELPGDAGVDYYIRVHGWNTDAGDYVLGISAGPAAGPTLIQGDGVCSDPDGDCDLTALKVAGRKITWLASREKLNDTGVCYTVHAPNPTSHSGGLFGVVVGKDAFVEGYTGGSTGVPFISGATGIIGQFENSHQIGPQSVQGSVSVDEGDPGDPKDDVITVNGTGTDIWNGGDRFQFAYKCISGDFQATARIVGANQFDGGETNLPGNNRWGRVGIMARYSCAHNSAYAMANQPYRGEVLRNDINSPDNDHRGHQIRRTHLNNGETLDDQTVPRNTSASHRRDDDGEPAQSFTGWMRLSRCGDLMFSEFAADVDGEPGEWVLGGASTHRDAPDALLVGLAVGAHGSGGGGGNNPLTVIFDNWCLESKAWGDRWSEITGDPVLEADFNGDDGPVEELVDGLVTSHWATWTNNFEPQRVAGRLRVTSDANGGTGATALCDAGGLGLVDGFKASVCAFYGDAAGGNPAADGFIFMLAEGHTLDDVNAGRTRGDGGGAEGYRGGDRHDPNRRKGRSFGVELDNWNGGAGSNDGVGANNPDPSAYHLGINTNWTHQSAQSTDQNGISMPAIIYEVGQDITRGVQLLMSYDPNAGPDGKDERARVTVSARIVDADCEPIEVIGEDGEGNPISGDLGVVLSQFVPRLSDDDSILIGFAGGTGGATANAEFDNLRVWASCNEDQDSVSIEGCPEETISVGDTVTFTANGSGLEGVGTYTWTVELDGQVIDSATGDTYTAVCPAEGEYTLTVVCEDEIVCCPEASDTCVVICEVGTIAKAACDWNNDGNLDLSDAVGLLSHLFLGADGHKCGPISNGATIAIMDTNGDGGVDLSDAVGKLNFLFLGGPRPQPMVAAGDSCLQVEDCEDEEPSCVD